MSVHLPYNPNLPVTAIVLNSKYYGIKNYQSISSSFEIQQPKQNLKLLSRSLLYLFVVINILGLVVFMSFLATKILLENNLYKLNPLSSTGSMPSLIYASSETKALSFFAIGDWGDASVEQRLLADEVSFF